MKIADLTEGFNPFAGLSSDGIPDGFRLVKDDRTLATYATVHDYHFVGADGIERLLHVVVGHPSDDPNHYHQLSFDVQDENGRYKPNIYDHGRSGDVMQAVAHSVRAHIDRFDPKQIQWIAKSNLRRMYRAILSKVAPGYEYSEDAPLGMITKVTES